MDESTHAVVLHSEAKTIIEKYIKNGSPFEVNVPSWQRNRVMKVFQDNKVTVKIFDEVHEEVFLLMRRDSFKRFLQSDLYKVYLKHADSKLARKVCRMEEGCVQTFVAVMKAQVAQSA